MLYIAEIYMYNANGQYELLWACYDGWLESRILLGINKLISVVSLFQFIAKQPKMFKDLHHFAQVV